MDTIELDAGEYQDVSGNTILKAELDALLDPDSDNDNQPQHEQLQKMSDFEQEVAGETKTRKATKNRESLAITEN